MSISLGPHARLPSLLYCWLTFASILTLWKSSTCILGAVLYTLSISFSVLHLPMFTGYTSLMFSSVQLLSRIWLFGTPWTAACQASLTITNCQSSLKLMSIESVMPSNHLILCQTLLLLPSIFPNISLFQWVSSSHQVATVLEYQVQHQFFQWIFRTDFL